MVERTGGQALHYGGPGSTPEIAWCWDQPLNTKMGVLPKQQKVQTLISDITLGARALVQQQVRRLPYTVNFSLIPTILYIPPNLAGLNPECKARSN